MAVLWRRIMQGPTQASPPLYTFLKSQNQRATHFMIGSNIKHSTGIFLQAFDQGDNIGESGPRVRVALFALC